MQQITDYSDYSGLRPTDRPLTLAVIGWSGFNSQNRVAPELSCLNGYFSIVGFDLRPPKHTFNGIPCIIVHDDDELAQQLGKLRPHIAIIETPCDCHPKHILIALEAGANLVLCEKRIGVGHNTLVDRLLPTVQAAYPEQLVLIIDHYLLLDLIMLLHENASRWLGEVVRMEVTLFEQQGVPPHQERSHWDGMANFFHHVIALASLWFDPNDLIPVEASWAKHPDAKVPDTYRSARFISKRTGDVVLEGAVGKYMGESTKLIRLYGTCGKALLDKSESNLIVVNQNLSVDVRCDCDSGYRGLVSALVNGVSLPPTLLTVEQALSILRLVEEAHDMAKQLPFYPDGQEIVFAEA